ncbi:MAG: hypothetical protein ABSA75_03135 [Candidatus Bathyarchaeia archaeon]
MAFKKLGSGTLIAITITSVLLVAVTAGLLTITQNVPANGTITAINLGVYSDTGCTVPLTAISFGMVTPGTQATQTVYLKNTGNIAENLTMTVNSWNPANAGTYLTLSWSPTSSTLAAGATTAATLTLAASSSAGALSTFSVNIAFTGTQ